MTFADYTTHVGTAVKGISIPNYTNIYYYNGGDSTTYTYAYNPIPSIANNPTVTGSSISTGSIINYQYVLDSFTATVNSVIAQLDDVFTAPTLYIGSCHTSCHSSCHSSRGRR